MERLGPKPLGVGISATPEAMPSPLFALCGFVARCGPIYLKKKMATGGKILLSQGRFC